MTNIDPGRIVHDQITGLMRGYLIVGCSCGWQTRIPARTGCKGAADKAFAAHFEAVR